MPADLYDNDLTKTFGPYYLSNRYWAVKKASKYTFARKNWDDVTGIIFRGTVARVVTNGI